MKQGRRQWVGKDFNKKKFCNPFKRPLQEKGIKLNRLRISRLLLFTSILSWGYFLFYSQIFEIKHIVINGTEKIRKDDIISLINEQITRNRFFIFTQKNIFIFSEKRLFKKFQEKYFVEKLEMKKSLPSKLEIIVEEKTPAFLIISVDQKILVDNKSQVIEVDSFQTSTSTTFNEIVSLDKEKNLPVMIYKNLTRSINLREKIFSEDILGSINSIQQNLMKHTDLVIEHISFESGDVPKIIISARQGFDIYFDVENIEKQISKLVGFLQSKAFKDREVLKYIDLRFGDRVYIK